MKTSKQRSWGPTFGSDDVVVERDTLLCKSFFQLRELAIRIKSFSGKVISVNRDLICKPDAVAVLLYDIKAHKVVLIEQFRIGAINDTNSPWLLEVVAGIVESGECIKEVAYRECMEETGLEVSHLEHIMKFSPSPGGVQENIDLFSAQVDSSKASGLHGLAEEGEDIQVHVFGIDEAINMLKEGRINNGVTIIALQWLQLNMAKISTN